MPLGNAYLIIHKTETRMTTRDLIMLPGPVEVDPEVLLASAAPVFNHRGPKFFDLYKMLRTKLQRLMYTNADVYFVTGSGTAGNEFAAGNLVGPKDKVVVCANGYFGERLYDTYSALTKQVVPVRSPWGHELDLNQIENAATDASVIAIVFNETSTGMINDVQKVAKVAKNVGALLVVDNVSGIGNEFRMDEWGIDVTVTASQKGIAAPPGVSFVYFSRGAKERAEMTEKNSVYFSFNLFEKYAEEFQTPATPAVTVLAAVNKALDIILDEGLEKFERRHFVNAEAFRKGVEAAGLSLFPERKYASNTVSAIKIPGKAKEIASGMAKRFGVIVAAGLGEYKNDILRVGHMGRVDPKDILATLGALELSLRDAGMAKKSGDAVSAALDFYASA